MTEPVYLDDLVSLYHADCRDYLGWLDADILITDPPYGRRYNRKRGTWRMPDGRPAAIAGDSDTALRDWALAAWGPKRPAAVFGDFMMPNPAGTKKVLVYRKPPDAGTHGALGGFRHDIEAIYLVGPWPAGIGGRTSVIETSARMVGGTAGIAGRYGHPHAKPVDVLGVLIEAAPAGVIADPFAGSCSTLIAARHLGVAATAVETDDVHIPPALDRLRQGTLL